MKQKFLILKVVAFVLAVSLLASCKKDKDSKTVKVGDYIEVENGSLVNSNLPDESGSNISALITSNTRALEGGSSPITISTNSSVSHLLMGIAGTSGYYQVSVADLQTTSNGYIATILFNSDMPTEEFTIVAEMQNEATNEIGGRTEIAVSSIQQSSAGKLQVSLSWDLLNDIDLHLVEPDANEIFYGNEGYISYDWDRIYSEHADDYYSLTESDLEQYILDDESTTGVLDLDSNPGCSIDSVNNENIIYIFPSDIKTGEYIVKVDFYSDCVGTGITNYIVTARYDNQLIVPTSGSNPYNGSFQAGTDDFGGLGDGVEIMRFNISEVKSTGNTKQHIYLEKPLINKGTINLNKLQQHLEYEQNK